MKEPCSRRRYGSLLRKRTKANWRNLKGAAAKTKFKHSSLLHKRRMRLLRKNSFQASKLPCSLRSSAIHDRGSKVRSPLHSFDSPETLNKKGKISRVSERSIHKVSRPPVSQDEREPFVVKRKATRGMDGEETKRTMTMGTLRSTELKGLHRENQGKLMKRAGFRKRDASEENIEMDNTSYRTKLRHKENNATENKEHKVTGSQSLTRLDTNQASKSLSQARAVLKSLRKQKRLLTGGGVTTRQKASSTEKVQLPVDVERVSNELSQRTKGNHCSNSDGGGVHGVGIAFSTRSQIETGTVADAENTKRRPGHRTGGPNREGADMETYLSNNVKFLTRDGKSYEGEPKFLKRPHRRGVPEEGHDRFSHGDAQQSAHTTLDQTINPELKSEELHKGGNRSPLLQHFKKRRTMNELDDPRQINSGERSPPARSHCTVKNLKESGLKLRRSKRKRSPARSEYLVDHRAPQKDYTGQTEDVALQDALIIGRGNDVVGEKFSSAHKVAENEIGPNLDAFKIDPASKSCLVATNPTETGGRQMRPRPLDLEQPLLVLVEGLDEDYYELDGGSFHRMLQQQPELKSPCVSQGKSNGGSRKASHAGDATGEKADSIVIPSFRTCTKPEDSLQHPALPYVLPDSYIKTDPAGENIQAEYDMDDADEEWLNKYNQSMSPSSTLSEDQFEKIIDLLENKAEDASGINSITGSLEEDQEPASEECCICNGGENSENNPVFQCADCHILVHQSCYGIQRGCRNEKKRRKWNCKKCEAIAQGIVPADTRCSLCCKQGGALKPTTEPHRWAHVVCALYTNETYFVNPDAMEPIDGLNAADVRAKRQRRQCWLCGVREGSVERCSVPGCKAVFHVSCGVTQGASFELQHSNHQVISVRVYCPKHALRALRAAKGRSSEDEKQNFSQESLSWEFSAAENISQAGKQNEISPARKHGGRKLLRHGKHCEKGANDHAENRERSNDVCNLKKKDYINRSVWGERVNAGLMKGRAMNEVPGEEACTVLSKEEMLELDHTIPNLSEGVYLYWVSKRAKQGGPLLHRIQQEHAAKQFGIFNSDDGGGPATDSVSEGSFLRHSAIDMKVVAAWQQLRRLQELTFLVVQRERLKLEIFSLDQDILKVSLQVLDATGKSQLCSSCKRSHFSLACAVCNKAICLYCLTKSARYSSWWDILKCPKHICWECEKQNIEMHVELACKPCVDREEDGFAGSSMLRAWNEVCCSDRPFENSQIASQKKALILLPRSDCSHQDKLAIQVFWEQTHPKTALLLDLLKNPI